MPGKVEFKIDTAGVGALLQSDFVAADIAKRAHAIASACGDGWKVSNQLSTKGDRVASIVYALTPKAIAENAKNHTLMRAMDAGRD
jgi:hypothetical protein